ncbi:MAG: dihydrodipicolinate synthase family protein, partial [Anaerolineales bacterium]
SYNFAAPLYNRITAAFEGGYIAEAQKLQGFSVKMIQTINQYSRGSSNLAPMKAVMMMIGLDCGPMRLPMVDLTQGEASTLESDLRGIGFFDWGRN